MIKVPSESIECIRFIQWLSFNGLKEFMIKIMNEAKMSPHRGKEMNNMGRQKGVVDYFFAFPTTEYPGLWLEMKRQDQKGPNPDQLLFMGSMIKMGYAAEWAPGWIIAANIIQNYLKCSTWNFKLPAPER